MILVIVLKYGVQFTTIGVAFSLKSQNYWLFLLFIKMTCVKNHDPPEVMYRTMCLQTRKDCVGNSGNQKLSWEVNFE